MKPTILVFFSNPEIKRLFKEFAGRYRFLFYKINTSVPVDEYIKCLESDLKSNNLRVHGVLGLSDPSAIASTQLAHNLGLAGPDPMSVYRAQHKAVFTGIAKMVCRHYPKTEIITDRRNSGLWTEYPAFIRPVKGTFSEQAYIVKSAAQLKQILGSLQKTKRKSLIWYDSFFRTFGRDTYVSLDSFILQPFIKAKQYTLDGFVFQNKVYILGVTETIYDKERKSFERFDFPANLKSGMATKLKILLEKLVQKLNYNNAGFNLEFFVTKDAIIIPIEFNTRIALQFNNLLRRQYRRSPLDMMLRLCVGIMPDISKKRKTGIASSCVLRSRQNKIVAHIPSRQELEKLKKRCKVGDIWLTVKEGEKLSDHKQDSYSFRYGLVEIFGKNKPDIQRRFNCVKENLPIVFSAP